MGHEGPQPSLFVCLQIEEERDNEFVQCQIKKGETCGKGCWERNMGREGMFSSENACGCNPN